VVLIDDARCFGGDKDYPSLQDLKNFVRGLMPAYTMGVSNDFICLVPSMGLSKTSA